jgi:hypothetical protein
MIDFYSAIKKYKIMSYTEKWMELEITLLHELSQTQINMFFSLCGIYIFKRHESRRKTCWEEAGDGENRAREGNGGGDYD